MPAKSPAQLRLMQAVAHNPAFARRVGIPQSVGREFSHPGYAAGGPVGALCSCAQRYADGGSVPSADELKAWDLPGLLYRALRARLDAPDAPVAEPSLAELRTATAPAFGRYPSSGRRPEALNASRDVNAPGQLARGFLTGTAGLPGDLESLGRMFIPGVSNTPTLPTSEFFNEWAPGRDDSPAGRAFSGLGSQFSGVGVGRGAALAARGAKAVGRGALGAIEAGMRGEGPLSGVVAPASPFFAIKPRGGNVKPLDEQTLMSGVGTNAHPSVRDWFMKNLHNYIRKDLGAPTDPMLALEKELPQLHFPDEENMPVSQAEIDRLYDTREKAKIYPTLLSEQRVGPDANIAKMATAYLNRHDELSGGAPLTRWGRAADSNMLPNTAGQDLTHELASQWPLQRMYPDLYEDTPPEALVEHARNMLARFNPGPAYPEMSREFSSRGSRDRERIQQFLEDAQKKIATDWRMKDPNAPVYTPLMESINDLGFSHIGDYLRTATEPYKSFEQLASPWIGEDWEPERVAQEIAASKSGYENLKNVFHGQPQGQPLHEDLHNSPYSQRQLRDWFALRDAGLLIDPKDLSRMSVPDVARKTAAWNEFMAKRQEASPALMKGWTVHKEYGPESGGMKWVKFSGDMPVDPHNLPEGLILKKNDESGQWAVYGEEYAPGKRTAASNPANTPEDALKQYWKDKIYGDIQEGLQAEGAAMGHCVGGYCPDVTERGTEIYSLRDAKGNPHVTVEVTPGQHNVDPYTEKLRELRYDAPEKWASYNDWLKTRISENPDYQRVKGEIALHDWAQETGTDLGPMPPPPPPEIVQIKGKQNAAPVEKYLPYVQDFVKSGQWSRVGDLRNTGLLKLQGGKTNIRDPHGTPNRRVFEGVSLPSGYHTVQDLANHLIAQGVPEDLARAHVGDYMTPRYAAGGSVKAEPEEPKGFLPRDFEGWVDYLEQLNHAATAQR